MQSKNDPETDNNPASLTEDLLLVRAGDWGCTSEERSNFLFRRLAALPGVALESLRPDGDNT